MKKIILVFGTRPEAIKMCPLVKEFQKDPDEFETVVCVTGQHREMLDQVLEIFGVKPDYDLNIMQKGQDLYDVTARVLMGMRDVLDEVKPDVVLVHGDTTTSMAAAMAAFYRQIPVGHVEAGLRTHNLYSPWPEEMNRQVTGRIATYDFAPTALSRQNLLNEGVEPEKITVTGNTVIDALHWVVGRIRNDKDLSLKLSEDLKRAGYDTGRLREIPGQAGNDGRSQAGNDEVVMAGYDRPSRRMVLITGHRRENFGEGFISMCTAIRDLARKYPEVDFVYPMHLNPNVRKAVREVFGEEMAGQAGHDERVRRNDKMAGQAGHDGRRNLFFIEPLDYLDFVYLMEKSTIVLTDSGGIQEEAPGLGKPVLVMRDTTERPEALEAGTVRLVGTDYERILKEVSLLLDNSEHYHEMSHAVNPYGDGKACPRIVAKFK